MKKILLLGIIGIAIQSVSYTQTMSMFRETQTNFTRAFHIYTEGNSGTLVNNTAGYFTGNELELGMQYYQNFETATWLSIVAQFSFLGTATINQFNENAGMQDAVINPKWVYNGISTYSIGVKDIELGLEFSQFYYFGITHRFTLKNLFLVPFRVGNTHTITLYSELDIQPFFLGSMKNPLAPDRPGTQNDPHLELFSLYLEYEVVFHPMLAFRTKIGIQSSGAGARAAGSTLPSAWELDSLDAFRANLHIRWDNTLEFRMDNGFYVWGSIRYQADRLIPHPTQIEGKELIGKTLHDVYLRFGLGFRFDLLSSTDQ